MAYSDKVNDILEDLEFDLYRYGFDEDLTGLKEEYIDIALAKLCGDEQYDCISAIKMRIQNQYMDY
jgi:hypothetical protein